MTRIILFLALFSLLSSFLTASGSEVVISGPETRVVDNELVVATGVTLDEKNLVDLKNGISKEITFHADLFRIWKTWPNEFITGKKIVRTLKADPIKNEFVATSLDGFTLTEKRFKSFDSMVAWALNLRDLPLVNVKDLESAEYFVRVSVESHLRSLPPIIAYLLFFVPEKDFAVTRDSRPLTVGNDK